MRTMILALLALAGSTAALAQTTEPQNTETLPVATMEQGVARPGGVYMTLPLSSPNACADACAADGLCMSWTFVSAPPARCELKAVIPHPVRDSMAVSGLAARAPVFARLVAPREIGPPRDLAAASQPPQVIAQAPAPAPPPAETRAETPQPMASLDGPEATRDPPPLPPPPQSEAPILLSGETAALPLRDRASHP